MSESLQIEQSISSEQKKRQLKAVLFLLSTMLEEMKNDVEKSDALLDIGEMTDLSKKIESSLKNPLQNLLEVVKDVDGKVINLIGKIVKGFLHSKKKLIHSVYQYESSIGELYYFIVLVEDSAENRDSIFEVLDRYETTGILSSYPVYFQFNPIEFIGEIKYQEEVKFGNSIPA
jgi:hypothetical protein